MGTVVFFNLLKSFSLKFEKQDLKSTCSAFYCITQNVKVAYKIFYWWVSSKKLGKNISCFIVSLFIEAHIFFRIHDAPIFQLKIDWTFFLFLESSCYGNIIEPLKWTFLLAPNYWLAKKAKKLLSLESPWLTLILSLSISGWNFASNTTLWHGVIVK